MPTVKQKAAQNKMKKVAGMWKKKSDKFKKTHKYTAFVKKHMKK